MSAARPDLFTAARTLRKNSTSAERKLWRGLRQRGVEGFRFRRQIAMLGFVVDFICFEARLVVEVDGATHSSESEIVRDRRRDRILRENGNAALRFNNIEVYENLDGVLETIRLKLLELCPNGPAMHSVPPPLVGEGAEADVTFRGDMKIYGDRISGNCQKVQLTADFLGLSYEWVDVDIMKGESRTPEFLALNPAGQVPIVVFDDGRVLAQSNAIVRFLARGSSLIPEDPFDQAKADEWMFWEQYSHEPYVAVARFQLVYLKKTVAEVGPRIFERGNFALDRLELGVTVRNYLVGERLSIADIALLPYTRLAHEGGFDLVERPAVRAWIVRCERELGLRTM